MSSAGSSDHKVDAIQRVPTERAGQTNVPPGTESSYTLVVFVNDHPGAVDRVIGLLRRRRASMQTLLIGRSKLQSYGIREVARTGYVAMTRGRDTSGPYKNVEV